MDDAGRIGFLIRGEYDSASVYNFLDIVYYNGSSYVAKKTTIGNEPKKSDEYWQIFVEGSVSRSESGVTAVKGNAETEYRTGKVNITPENIGTYGKTVIDSMQKTIDDLVKKVGLQQDDLPDGYSYLSLSDRSNLVTDSGEKVIVTT